MPLHGRPSSCSSDLDSRSKAAAWVWHMRLSSSAFPNGKFVSHCRSGSQTCKKSRFRLEAMQDFSPQKPASPHKIWDCGSKLYDSFELVSFTDRLDRSLIGIPTAGAANFHHVRSPLHQTCPGLLRTFSLPRNMSINGAPHSNARPTSHFAGYDSCCLPPSSTKGASTKKSRKRWSFRELVKIFKKVATMHVRTRRRKGEQEFDLKNDNRHFYHHHLHRMDDLEDGAANLAAENEDYSTHIKGTRAESARLSPATLSKICLDHNWW